MQTGRKIMNLRRDRSISQQDLASYCRITPSALSKIESGQNSPRGGVIFRIAKNLGVTVEYLLDEEIPYPCKGLNYRQETQANIDPDGPRSRMDVSPEEKAFLMALSRPPSVEEKARMIELLRTSGGGSGKDSLVALCRVLFNTSEFIYID